jgi:hypothetical protein
MKMTPVPTKQAAHSQILGAHSDIVLLALAVRTAGLPPPLLNLQFLQ